MVSRLIRFSFAILFRMKYLCIDYGSKKVGFAQSDDNGDIAFPLMISENGPHLLKETFELIRELKIDVVVIGESVDGKGKLNPIAKEARVFGAKIEDALPVRIVYEKEWFSTTEARKQPGKEGDHEVDDQAAAIILQRYLDRTNGPASFGEDETLEDADEGESADASRDNW